MNNDDHTQVDNKIHHHLPYPKGQPWRVLWPTPHDDQENQNTKESPSTDASLPRWRRVLRKIPRLQHFKRAWTLYLQTWEDGISGRPSLEKLERQALAEKLKQLEQAEMMNQEDKTDNNGRIITTTTSQADISDDNIPSKNAARNLQLIRQDAARLLDQAKEQTGIHTKDDLKALATEMMKLGTECLREFMAGYREGRDQEMDKMLNEYFQDELKPEVQPPVQLPEQQDQTKRQQSQEGPSHDNDEYTIRPPRKRRRPKRGIPRD
jgi:hypothetical protein